jgi:hypothetical protein
MYVRKHVEFTSQVRPEAASDDVEKSFKPHLKPEKTVLHQS